MPDRISTLPSRIIQVAARFRPDADGVGETALNLGDVLFKDHGIPSDFIAYNPPRPDSALEIPENFPHTAAHLAADGAISFNRVIDRLQAGSAEPCTMLLHYVSYGFSGQGTPFWLPPALDRFKSRGGRVLTLFHELYAIPRFPSRTFFTSWFQRRIFRRVLAASEAAFTSSEEFISLAERDNYARRPISLIGICSSAGEPENPRPLAARTRRLSVFGRFPTRQQLYANHLPALEEIVRHLGITEIADIGPVDDSAWLKAHVAAPLGTLFRSYGTLSVPDASRLFEDSLVGALVYPRHLLGKSSVFAAYQAHATAILLFADSGQRHPREPWDSSLSAEEVLALPSQSPALVDRLQQSADASHEHYNRNRSARSMVATLLPALRKPTR